MPHFCTIPVLRAPRPFPWGHLYASFHIFNVSIMIIFAILFMNWQIQYESNIQSILPGNGIFSEH